MPTNPGRAPAEVEACYARQLDAMRLPEGIISKVSLPDGTITEVPGRGLQRPPSFEMDDFEKSYWKANPVVTKEMTSKFVDVRVSSEDGSPRRIVDYLGFNRLSVARFVALYRLHGRGLLTHFLSAMAARCRKMLETSCLGTAWELRLKTTSKPKRQVERQCCRFPVQDDVR